jgi:hypothetical protein
MDLTRKCGDCRVCCSVLAIEELRKPVGEPLRARHSGIDRPRLHALRDTTAMLPGLRVHVDRCRDWRRPASAGSSCRDVSGAMNR